MWNRQQGNRQLFTGFIFSLLWISSSFAVDKLRLAGPGSTQCSGRVEVLYNNTWGTVCDDTWGKDDAEVVCRELGCGTALSAPSSAHFGQGYGKIWLDDVNCLGNESSLTSCQHPGYGIHNCGHGEDAGVVCSGSVIRLSGSTSCSGRVEIYNGTWGTVCDDNWDLTDAQVVCKQLSCGTALKVTSSAVFGAGTGQIWLDEVNCLGNEVSLTSCQHPGYGIHNCEHSEDAGVVCSESLPKPTIFVSPVVELTWGQQVSITCASAIQLLDGTFILQKTLDPFRMAQSSGSTSATFRIPKVTLDHHGEFNCQYEKRISSETFTSILSDSVHLTVHLLRPNISLTFPNVGVVWKPKEAEVTRGYRFSFTCSINPNHPQGNFSLIFSGSNITETKPAVNSSASFNFPIAAFEHQGNYSCVYVVLHSTRRFSSAEAVPIRLVIMDSSQMLLYSLSAGILLLVLLVFLGVCLACNRRHCTKHPLASDQNRMTVQHFNTQDHEDDWDDYENVDIILSAKKLELDKQSSSNDDHDHEEAGPNLSQICVGGEDNKVGEQIYEEYEESSEEEESDYVNVSVPWTEKYGAISSM